MSEELRNARPFLKWVGGKGQILDKIRLRYPRDFGKGTNKYAEPFVGGGAVLFDILNTYELDAVFAGDVNAELMNTYRVVRDEPENLLGRLLELQTRYHQLGEEGKKLVYYEERRNFNQRIVSGDTGLEKAALMIFLNKTCFNGLYRVNKDGLFNSPVGRHKKPLICDEEGIVAASNALRKAELVCGDYTMCESFVDKHTFVYFDPPYRPLKGAGGFAGYNSCIFDDSQQVRLAGFVRKLDRKGAGILLSNSDPKNTVPDDTFFEDLYSGFKIYTIDAVRSINRIGTGRGPVKELLITNMQSFIDWLSDGISGGSV